MDWSARWGRRRFALSACWALAGSLLVAVLVAAPAHAAFPGKNGKLAFGDGNHGISVANPDGTGQTALTTIDYFSGLVDDNPAWSPDGTRIAFGRECFDTELCLGGNVLVVDASGGSPTALTSSAGGVLNDNPAWSPDGTKIAFQTNRDHSTPPYDYEIYTMNPDGSGQTDLSNRHSSAEIDPAWSPDGQKIAFESNRDDPNGEIYTMNADGSGVTRLTVNPGLPDEDPSWSPDGQKIAFTRWIRLASVVRPEIYVMNADGSDQQDISNDLVGFDESSAWSPDGKKIAWASTTYTTPNAPPAELSVMNPDGSGKTPLGICCVGDIDWQPLPGPQRSDFKNAAQFCKAEREFLGESGFAQKYGANGNGANAFGKCVSANGS